MNQMRRARWRSVAFCLTVAVVAACEPTMTRRPAPEERPSYWEEGGGSYWGDNERPADRVDPQRQEAWEIYVRALRQYQTGRYAEATKGFRKAAQMDGGLYQAEIGAIMSSYRQKRAAQRP